MSMYGESEHARQMNNLYDEIRNFLEDNDVSELLKVVTDAVESKELLACQYCLAKIKEYEEEQKKAEAEIKVGDEVIVPNGKRCVVTGFNHGDNRWYLCIDETGDCGPNYHEKTDLKKTGRHFPQIEEVLKQMKGE